MNKNNPNCGRCNGVGLPHPDCWNCFSHQLPQKNPMHTEKNPDLDTKQCINGHVMKGIGFDYMCPECEGEWVNSPEVGLGWEKDLNKFYGAMFECGDYEALVEFVRNLLSQKTEEIRKEIILLIAKECNIARSENQTTSRLTSLAVKVSELLK